jgi:hypothetical protein
MNNTTITEAIPPDPQINENKNHKFNWNEISILAPLLSLYTSAYLILALLDFFLKTSLELPEGLQPLYLALLGAYATDKEVRRWIGLTEPPRKGSIFVYLWFLLFLFCYLISIINPSYIIPPYLVPVCLEVLAIFFGTKLSKNTYSRYVITSTRPMKEKEEIITSLIKQTGKATRQTVSETLGISTTSAWRLLTTMEQAGKIKKIGEGKKSSYVLPNP